MDPSFVYSTGRAYDFIHEYNPFIPIHTFIPSFLSSALSIFKGLPLGEMDWLYVWSPRYRFFHELLFSSIRDLSGFTVKPVFAEQHLFTPMKAQSLHFLAGIPIKIYIIINYIKQNMGKFFFFTDVDLIVLPGFQSKDLESYKQNKITCMNEVHAPIPYNIGCLLILCCEETLTFFERVLKRIQTEKLLDQDAFHQEIVNFQGPLGMFDPKHFLQSNMIDEDSEDYKIIQCLCSETDPTMILVEKILTISSFYDISSLKYLLPSEVLEALDTETRMR